MKTKTPMPVSEDLGLINQSYDQITKMAIGGMAEIYRARQKSLDRPVAIKRIRPELRSNRDIQERFRREAKSSANLLHQNLAHVYDYIKHDDDAFIIMEWIDGFDLAEVIERTSTLPVDVATMVAIKTLHGLSYVHSHGMVHRDLKPDNIRVSIRGEVKIMDFGIALDPSDQSLTMPGTLIGSPHYLAPEQILGGKLDHKVDIFAFGICFYEILTGKKPFFETQHESVYSRIQKGEYIPPQNIKPNIPPFVAKIIENCLQVKPARRPKSSEDLAASLTQFLVTNFSTEYEQRTRQFLIQSGLLHGNANLIEVVEKTSDTGVRLPVLARYRQLIHFYLARRLRLSTVLGLLAAIILVVILWGTGVLRFHSQAPGQTQSLVNGPQTPPPVTAAPAPATAPTPVPAKPAGETKANAAAASKAQSNQILETLKSQLPAHAVAPRRRK